MNWEKHEQLCVAYLNKVYQQEGVHFKQIGLHDSTVPDIAVQKEGQTLFYMEVKMPSAQSGQFVVKYDGVEYKESTQNTNKNSISSQILVHMNQNQSVYNQCGTKGVQVQISEALAIKWIKEHYQKKGVQYFITKATQGYCITHLDDLENKYTTKTMYRVKRSGSRDLSPKWEDDFKTTYFSSYQEHSELKRVGRKTYLINSINVKAKDTIESSVNRYYFSDDPKGFRVKILSKTANANVIFSLFLNPEVKCDQQSFKARLQHL